jgi:DNA-binding HxlR family transcriptional regulator
MKLLKILASTGTAEILLAMKEEPRHFGELAKLLDYPLISTSSSLATRRLKTLENLGLVNRTVKQDRKRRVEYALTQMGKEITKLLYQFDKWDKDLCSRGYYKSHNP